MMKWSGVHPVHFSVVGDYEGEATVVQAGTNGIAPVRDHVEIAFDYKQGLSGQLAMMVRTDYPAAQMTVACTGGQQAVAAHSASEQEDFIVPGIMLLAMGDALTGDLTVSKDAKSFIVKHGGWTYIYTPSKVR